MPREEVRDRCNRLPKHTKRQPKDQIADQLRIMPFGILEHVRQEDQRQLPYHPKEREAQNVVRRHSNQQLMQDPREQEGEDLSYDRWYASPYHWSVDMSFHEMRYGLIPGGPVGAHGRGVPPVAVEFAVGEAHYLGQTVHEALEQGEEAGEPADEADGRQLEDAL